jgi:RimJ/RimL family protein N-acetyltransferase
VTDRSEDVARWVHQRYGHNFLPPFLAIGIMSGPRIIGAAVLNAYDASNVELSAVGRGAFTLKVCRELADLAFNKLMAERVSITVRASDQYVLRLARKFGWRDEGRKRRYYGAEDALILGMLRIECPYLGDGK